MKIVLPITKFTVEISDYITQRVIEAVDDVTYGRIKASDNSWKRVTIDQIALSLGPLAIDAINSETDTAKREKMMENAQKEVAAMDPMKGGVSLADLLKANRVKVVHMIKSIKPVKVVEGDPSFDIEDKHALTQWVLDLPAEDFKKLDEAVRKLDKAGQENLKGTEGQ